VHGHGHPFVMIVDTADDLGQVRLDVAQRKHCHSQKYDQKLRDRQTTLADVLARRQPCTDQFTNHMRKALSLFEKGPLALVAGEGFEPSTSGL
jgi:hypothetical protein